MKIAFFASYEALDYHRIGGTESYTRRLSQELVRNGVQVDWVVYGSPAIKDDRIFPGLRCLYVKDLPAALNALSVGYQHVVTLYLSPGDRIPFARFRRRYDANVKFHFVYFSWPDSALRRHLYFAEAKFFPYNGRLFCISGRQYRTVSSWSRRAVLLVPPVPEDYILKPIDKVGVEKIRLTFLGRVDPGKGIAEVIEIFEALSSDPRYECSIFGIHFETDPKSRKIHEWLKAQNNIKYTPVNRQRYSVATDVFVRKVLSETDVFLQPYKKLSSTVDTPLLILESMASSCAILTKPYGDIPDIYGKSDFILPAQGFVQSALDLLRKSSLNAIRDEQQRVHARATELSFSGPVVARQFLKEITQ